MNRHYLHEYPLSAGSSTDMSVECFSSNAGKGVWIISSTDICYSSGNGDAGSSALIGCLIPGDPATAHMMRQAAACMAGMMQNADVFELLGHGAELSGIEY